MSSWRDSILNNFVPNVSKLTLVADPDCLLTEEKMALELRGRGFDLIEFSDPIEVPFNLGPGRTHRSGGGSPLAGCEDGVPAIRSAPGWPEAVIQPGGYLPQSELPGH